jgi:hypothetical protein
MINDIQVCDARRHLYPRFGLPKKMVMATNTTLCSVAGLIRTERLEFVDSGTLRAIHTGIGNLDMLLCVASRQHVRCQCAGRLSNLTYDS